MNYEDMSDFEINKLVAGIVTDGDVIDYCDMFKGPTDDCVQVIYKIGIHGEHYDYCNNPSDAWPVIEQIWETLNDVTRFDILGLKGVETTIWKAYMCIYKCGAFKAAMICFLKMKDAEL